MPDPGDTTELIDRIRSALARRDPGLLAGGLAEDVRWGPCVGPAEVVRHLAPVFAGDVTIEDVQIDARGDRLVVGLDVTPEATGSDAPPSGPSRQTWVLFVRDGRIVELQQVAGGAEAAISAEPSPPLPPPDETTRLNRLAAVLPVRDLDAALRHYRRLGFDVEAYDRGGYGYAERDGLDLHLAVVRELDPDTTTSAVYLYVDDADALFAEWRSAGVTGRFFPPTDTEYGLREGAHIDPDGNLLRFGSPLPGRRSAAE